MSINFNGNKKMTWPTWSLPAISTCPNSTPECRRTCYAMKAQRQYPSAKNSRKDNLKASKRAVFISKMQDDILSRHNKKPIKIFRIHESGDFYSREYFRSWCKIAGLFPDIQFYAFTKVYKILKEQRPRNLILIASKYYDDTRPVPKGVPVFYTVRKGDSMRNAIHCAGNCDTCGVCPYANNKLRVYCEVH